MSFNLAALARSAGVRKSRPLPNIEATAAHKDRLRQTYMRVVLYWERQVREKLMPAYRSAVSDSFNDFERELEQAEQGARVLIAGLTIAGGEIPQWASVVEAWHRNRVIAGALSAAKVDVSTLLSPFDAQRTVQEAIAWNTSLISNVSEDMRERIANAFFAGFRAQTPPAVLGREITKATGIGRRRAKNIAADQTVKLSAALDRARQAEMGLTEWVWRSSHKINYRPDHLARDGKHYANTDHFAERHGLNKPPSDQPGELPYCFPSGQPIGAHDDIFVFWRRESRSELLEFVTASGESIRSTPNHPILTNAGWKAAKDIEVGDQLVEVKLDSVEALDMNVEQRQATIGEMFETVQALFGSVTSDASGGEFHGDAARHENIDVVNIEGGLRSRIVPPSDEPVVQLFLKNAEVIAAELVSSGAGELFATTDTNAPAGLVRGFNLLAPLFWREPRPNEQTLVAGVSSAYALALDKCGESATRYAEAFVQRFDAFARQVTPDRLRAVILGTLASGAGVCKLFGEDSAPFFEVLGDSVSIKAPIGGHILKHPTGHEAINHTVEQVIRRSGEPHVYNLQTVSGWYSAGKIAVKNCGCTRQAWLRLEGEQAGEGSSWG